MAEEPDLRKLIKWKADFYSDGLDAIRSMNDIDAVRFIQEREGHSRCFGLDHPLVPLRGAVPLSEQQYCGMLDCVWRQYCNDLRGCIPKEKGIVTENPAEAGSNWNVWRQRNRGATHEPLLRRILDVSGGINLEGKNLQKAHLSNLDLRRRSFVDSDLSESALIFSNLSSAKFTRAVLIASELRSADLSDADLAGANLQYADFTGANLTRASLKGANLSYSNFMGANLTDADLSFTHLDSTILRGAILRGANFVCSRLLYTDFAGADLTGCRVYGVSAWDIVVEGTIQSDLIITRPEDATITVDNLEVAQFVYLLLNNARIRAVIDSITSKVVLLLGRFTPERKALLDAIRGELRRRNYLPVLFDFEKPAHRTTLEAVSTLAHIAKFVIADLTDAKSVLEELMAVVPNNPSVPVQPLLLASQDEPGMLDFFKQYPWFLESVRYERQDILLAELQETVIGPAEARATGLGNAPSSGA